MGRRLIDIIRLSSLNLNCQRILGKQGKYWMICNESKAAFTYSGKHWDGEIANCSGEAEYLPLCKRLRYHSFLILTRRSIYDLYVQQT